MTPTLASQPLQGCDRIYVLSEGLVVEQGTHAALMAARGVYAEMFEMQRAQRAFAQHLATGSAASMDGLEDDFDAGMASDDVVMVPGGLEEGGDRQEEAAPSSEDEGPQGDAVSLAAGPPGQSLP